MIEVDSKISNSGASKIWADLAKDFDSEMDDFSGIDDSPSGSEFRDEYVRLPYEDLPSKQECRW